MASEEQPGATNGGESHVEQIAADDSSSMRVHEPDHADVLPSKIVAGEQPAASDLVQSVAAESDDDDEDDDRRKRMPAGEDETSAPQARSSSSTVPVHSASSNGTRKAAGQITAAAVSGRGNRYFIMKSINHENIGKSVAEGIWATQGHNESKLNEAFRSVNNVYLIFSVNISGCFQGYARMTSPAMKQARSSGSFAGFDGNTFGIQWQRVFDLQFHATEQLRNPLNEGKPVKISRDGQELPADVGEQMVQLFVKLADAAGVGPPPPPQRSSFRPGPVAAREPPPRPAGFRPAMSIADPNAMVFDEMGRPIGNVNSLMRPGMGGAAMGGWRGDGMHGPPGMGMMMGPVPGYGMVDPRAAMMGSRGPIMNGGRGMGPRFGYDQDMGGQGFQRPRSPVPRRPQPPSSRSRSRSPSNQHRRRRHRSPSRSRSPEHTHNDSRRHETSAARSFQAEAPNLLNMSYDEYLEYFERMRKQRGAAAGPPAPAPPAGPPPPQQSAAGRLAGGLGMPGGLGYMGMAGRGGMGHMGMGMGMPMGVNVGMGMGMGMLGAPAMGMGFGGMPGGGGPSMGGSMTATLSGMNGQAMAPVLMAENEYIQTCEKHAAKTGIQVSRQQIKQHYQQIVGQMLGR